MLVVFFYILIINEKVLVLRKLKLEKSQYQNSLFQLNYGRYEKKVYTKLFAAKSSTNLNCNIFLWYEYFSS